MNDENKALDPALVLGVFLSVFGVCVLIAIPVTPSSRGQIVNLVCGLLILLVSGIFVLVSRRGKRRKQ